VLIGALSAVGGLRGAWVFDTPAGPSIVCAAAGLFVIIGVWTALRDSLIKGRA
jgi:zinc transport system permease protein